VIREVLVPARCRAEAGCVAIYSYCSTRDERLFFIHSCWVDEAAFERHAGEPHTPVHRSRYALIDRPLDVQRTLFVSRHGSPAPTALNRCVR